MAKKHFNEPLMKFLALLPFYFFSSLLAHEGHSHHPTSDEMKQAASLFLASLDDAQKQSAQIKFSDDERENWHFFPMERGGIRLGALKPHQQQLAYGLLATGLTQKGFMTATQIMALEQILRERGGDPDHRDPQKYYLAIFGHPKKGLPWGWRFEGHHLSLNFTLPKNLVGGTPMFFGASPAEIKDGSMKGIRPLGEIEDLARAFAQKLHREKLSPVFSEKPPKEILTGQDQTARLQPTQGITSDQMKGGQIIQLLGIIDSVAGLQRKEIANDSLRKIHTIQRKKLHFAWGGSLERGQPHYFRIQGTDFLIEYANTQQGGNHAHLVWRDLKNDFGRDFLKEHLEKDH